MRLQAFLLLAVCGLAAAAENTGDQLLGEIRKGDLAAVRASLARGADVNSRDAKAATALMYAAIYGDVDFVNLLLEKGADPNASNDLGINALMWAAGDLAKVRTLVAHGASINARSNSGVTALSVASASPGNLPTVRLLLEKGADPKAVDKDGVGALWLACARGDSQIVQELLRHGASPNETHSRLTETALMWASKLNRPLSVQALLKAGVDVNQRSAIRVPVKSGQQDVGETTALLWAAPQERFPDRAGLAECPRGRQRSGHARVYAPDAGCNIRGSESRRSCKCCCREDRGYQSSR